MTTSHGSNLPLLKVLASPFVSLHEALTVGEDRWTWTTNSGDFYEDVVLLDLSHDTVTIQHKYGVDTIARADLDNETQQFLVEGSDSDEMYDEGDHDFAPAEGLRRAA